MQVELLYDFQKRVCETVFEILKLMKHGPHIHKDNVSFSEANPLD